MNDLFPKGISLRVLWVEYFDFVPSCAASHVCCRGNMPTWFCCRDQKITQASYCTGEDATKGVFVQPRGDISSQFIASGDEAGCILAGLSR
ncbi:hypothetical protein M8J75_008796 [Diaphorina citri]|nr:hypothetical protein M8J75_008796 [Diaphorina citri]